MPIKLDRVNVLVSIHKKLGLILILTMWPKLVRSSDPIVLSAADYLYYPTLSGLSADANEHISHQHRDLYNKLSKNR